MDGLGEVLQQIYKRSTKTLHLLSGSTKDLQLLSNWCMMASNGLSVSQGERRPAPGG